MAGKRIAILCALALCLCALFPAAAENTARPDPGVSDGSSYVSDHLQGASALYAAGTSVMLDNAFFYGAGFASQQEIDDQIPNQYGICSVVLGVGQDTDITLNNPTIQSDPESYANGVFAAAMAKITVSGGSIHTNNSSGHGVDATYMGHVYISGTSIHTEGETSGALATDFGGGFISAERLDCRTESGSSPGIFCAGSTVMLIHDSSFTTGSATGIVVAHDHAVVVLDHCTVDAAGTAVSGLQALPNAASSDGSAFYAFGGKLSSRSGAVVGESGGRTVVNLIGTECVPGGETAISASGSSAGILTVNLWDTELNGRIECAEGCSVTVNLYAGAKLTGEVSGAGTVAVNVYDGGEYTGSFTAAACGAGEPAPVLGSFDDYLVSCWASGSQTWTESRAKNYAETIEPAILANSAATLAVEGASAKPYDPTVYNPSEGGIDLSLLNVGGAHGFSVDEIFGGGTSEDGASDGSQGGASDGSEGGSAGSSGAPGEIPEGIPEGITPPDGGAWSGQKPEGWPDAGTEETPANP